MLLIAFMVPFLVEGPCRHKSRFCIACFDEAILIHCQVFTTIFCDATLILDFLILEINAPLAPISLCNGQNQTKTAWMWFGMSGFESSDCRREPAAGDRGFGSLGIASLQSG
jgi:hypothetical protein